jgi:myo-inositol-1(or 4)-monophosphatase
VSAVPADEAELLAIANAAADAAASELLSRFGHTHRVRAKTTPTDPVSEADVSAEAAIRQVLARERPGDAILGEEGGATAGAPSDGDGAGGRLRWIVDPLDGTVNFIYGIPVFAVSVACEDGDGTIVGVVLDPVRGERFEATRSGPATVGGVQIHGSAATDLASALVGTGFAYDAAVRARQARVLDGLLGEVRDIRRAGSAALDLCSCACGRLDAYFERDVHPWDIAAGVLVCERAGVVVQQLQAQDGLPAGVAAGPPALIDSLLALVAAVH